MEPANRLMRHLAFFTLVIGVSAAVIFLSIPQIDIWVASQFKTETGFLLSNTDLAYFQKKLIRYLTILSAAAVITGTIIAHLRSGTFILARNKWRFLFASLAIGPGIFVNAFLKELWGRARPQNVEALGGDATFTPPFIITDQCDSNCSFVSGDSAIAFWTMALAFVVPAKWRPLTLVLTFAFGVLISLGRMGLGKHFLSDTLFAFVFVTLITALSWGFIVARANTNKQA